MPWVLTNRLQIVISDLVEPEKNSAVHFVREVLEGIKDRTEAALINLDQSKAFDRVDHWFLVTVLETAGFKPEFRKWISMMYHNPQAVAQVNEKRSGAFVIDRQVRQGCPCLHSCMSSLWSPYSVDLGMRRQVQLCTASFLLALL